MINIESESKVKNFEVKDILKHIHCFLTILSQWHPKVSWVNVFRQSLQSLEGLLSHWNEKFSCFNLIWSHTFRRKILKKEVCSCLSIDGWGFHSYLIKKVLNIFTCVKITQGIEEDWCVTVNLFVLFVLFKIFHLHSWSENTLTGPFCRRSVILKTCKRYQDVFVVFVPNGMSS